MEVSQVRSKKQMILSATRDNEFLKRVDDEFPGRAHESAAAADWMPDVIQEKKECFKLLLRSIEKLQPRARRVVLLYYKQNLTMKQIGNLLHVNESRISQIHKTAIQTMSAMIQSPGRLHVAERKKEF